jgi:hypothetical protein
MTNKIPKKGTFPVGVSGNPLGRPLGSRNHFSAIFVGDLTASWAQHGPSVLDRVAKQDPSRFLGVCASVLPKDVALSIEQRLPGGMSASDLEVFQAIRQAIPNANDRQPGEVLNFVLEAIRAHDAKLIEGE